MLEEIKKHPYIIFGVIGGIILLYILSSAGGSGNATASGDTGDDDSDVAAAEATNQASIAANAQIAGYQAAAGAQSESDSASLSLANIQAGVTNNANDLSAAVAAQQINAEEETTDTANTLSAQTTQYGEQQQTQQLGISTNGQTQDIEAVTSALVQQQQISAGEVETVAGINAGVLNNQIAAQQTVATQSWVSKIF